jgi:antitoxin CptB
MDRDIRLKRLNFRATHRGTKEADILVGQFCAARCAAWEEPDIVWFEAFLDEQDVDILAWATGAADIPERLRHPLMDDLKSLSYLSQN